jgi:6-phosphogluconolactonase
MTTYFVIPARTAIALAILVLTACGGGGGGNISRKTYTVGGTVSGLTGSGLVLRDNGADDLPVSANGTFTFPTPVASGGTYAVSVNVQPANSNQKCVVSNGNGVVGSTAVATVGITCTNLVYLYVANHDSDDVSGFSVDENTGALTAVPGNPLLAGWSGPQSGAIDPTGRFAYFANSASNNASAFSIDSITGELTPVAKRPIVAVPEPVSVSVDPSGKFTYVVSNNPCPNGGYCDGNGIFAYTIDPITGALTPVSGSPFSPNVLHPGPFSAATVDPNGKFVYMTAGSNAYAFVINPTTGALSPAVGNLVGTGTGLLTSVAIELRGKFAYIGEQTYFGSLTSNNIYPFTLDSATGALTPVGGSVVAGSFGVSIDPQGKFLFDGIDVFAINATTGTLTNVTGSASPAGPGPATFDPASAFAYAANHTGVWAYTVDELTGAYGAVAGSPFPAGGSPTTVTIEPQGKFAYVTNSSSDTISAYAIDVASGALRPLTHGASGLGNPAAIAADPGGRIAYVANNRSGRISQYSIQGATGVFGQSPISTAAAATSIVSVAVEPRGRFVYAVNEVPYDVATGTTPPGNVFAYSLDASTGALTAAPGSPFPTGKSPKAIAFDPGGNFAYVANYASQDLSIYAIDRTTGALVSKGSGPPVCNGGFPKSITVDPRGTFVFVTGVTNGGVPTTDGYITVCAIDASTGALSGLTNNNFWLSGQSSAAVAAEPSGKFVYVVNNGSNDVSAYAVDAGTGTLTPVAGSPFPAGIGPIAISVDLSGKFAFVLDAGSSPGQILTFSIGPTGALSQLPGGATKVGSGPVAISVAW